MTAMPLEQLTHDANDPPHGLKLAPQSRDLVRAEHAARDFLVALGVDLERADVKDTPRRLKAPTTSAAFLFGRTTFRGVEMFGVPSESRRVSADE